MTQSRSTIGALFDLGVEEAGVGGQFEEAGGEIRVAVAGTVHGDRVGKIGAQVKSGTGIRLANEGGQFNLRGCGCTTDIFSAN